MRAKIKIVALIVIALVLMPLYAFAALTPLTDCSKLKKPITILVVHASWCPACKQYMPVYTRISNDKKYKNWTFYEKTDDNWSEVCGVAIPDVPHVFVNNMKELPDGDNVDVLTKYLEHH